MRQVDNVVLKQLEDSIHAHNGSFTLRIKPNPIAAELAEECALALADMRAVTGTTTVRELSRHDPRCKWLSWELKCTCAELRFVDGIDRDIQALHDHWDTEKACARDRKYYEYGPNGVFDFNHGNGPPPPPTTADHLARAFALSAPAESERQEYLAPYRMREGFGG